MFNEIKGIKPKSNIEDKDDEEIHMILLVFSYRQLKTFYTLLTNIYFCRKFL